ncbi:Hypothetical protein NTJ_07244 [Nesidiocoris tenuis]|uniref:Uncharacterized protein n=1 Tax=Nesidiocoris tenuis TaxID=355587 RepID=A0ABN7AQF8_9HEMI|nr:Hypothetical protein NTJ_07244 [Nesidiocoris tenuis]
MIELEEIVNEAKRLIREEAVYSSISGNRSYLDNIYWTLEPLRNLFECLPLDFDVRDLGYDTEAELIEEMNDLQIKFDGKQKEYYFTLTDGLVGEKLKKFG